MVAVGCLAERYGTELADSLPEADAVLGFDDYPDIAGPPALDRRGRDAAPAHAAGPAPAAADLPGRAGTRPATPGPVPARPRPGVRRRLDAGPMAPLKLATGCDRRCTFCAIPAFRGSFVSRRPSDVLAEARWLAGRGRARAVPGQRELHVLRQGPRRPAACSRRLLPELAAVDGVDRVRVSYLQPAETRPGTGRGDRDHARRRAVLRPVLPARQRTRCCAGCAASATRRASSGCSTRSAGRRPEAGVRSNFIVGFPGETEDDLEILCDFLVAARLDAIGVFGYSDEDGTEAETFDDKLDEDEIRDRVEHVTALVEELTAQRAEERIGEEIEVLVENVGGRRRRGSRRPPGPRGRRLDLPRAVRARVRR